MPNDELLDRVFSTGHVVHRSMDPQNSRLLVMDMETGEISEIDGIAAKLFLQLSQGKTALQGLRELGLEERGLAPKAEAFLKDLLQLDLIRR